MEAAVQDAYVAKPRNDDAADDATQQVGLRLPVMMLKEIDALAPKGFTVPRSEVIRVLLREALDARKQRKK